MKKLITVACMLGCLTGFAQDHLNVVPRPVSVKTGKGSFALSAKTVLLIKNGADEATAGLFNAALKERFGFTLKKAASAKTNFIQFVTLQTLVAGREGAYSLDIASADIAVKGQTASGTFAGMQTLLQLLPYNSKAKTANNSIAVPQLSIADYPRFQYRGMHLDVARHFMPVDFIKKYIDCLAAYKYNTFHWHLTDDQGWRVEIKKYPLLTQKGAWRNGTIIGRYPGKGNDNTVHGGFYTQEQVKDIVQYAAARYITVIPEIEMPGHASAAIAAYPQLSCFPDEDTKIPADCAWSGPTKGKLVQQTWGVFEDVFAPTDYTFGFLQDVLDEVITLFPSKYIHIGGDECPKESWKRSAFCQQLIKEQHLKDEHGLQSYFISHIEKYLNSKGRNIIGWDEILEGGLAPNATVMSWRGEEGGIEAAKQNHDVVMTPGSHCYIDHSQSRNEDSVTIGGYLPVEKVYSYEPVPAVLNEEQAKHILGAQANLWTEYVAYPSKAEYMIFPRMMALSEVLWSPKEKRDWNDFERRLPVLFERLEKQGINYSKAYYDLNTSVQAVATGGIEWKVSSKKNDEHIKIQYDGPLRIFMQKSGKGTVTMPVTKQGMYSAAAAFSGLRLSQQFNLNKATGKNISIVTAPSKSYPGDGAFTLVNGVQNEMGLAKSSEFLGFLGTDMDVTIDLGTITTFNKVVLHSFSQPGSWIYQPAKMEVYFFNSANADMSAAVKATAAVQQQNGNLKTEVSGNYNCRYVRVLAKNFGTIPSGNPGAGTPAWLFVDEIEVE